MRKRNRHNKPAKPTGEHLPISLRRQSIPQSASVTRIIGMVSIKTIRGPQGTIIIRQGERISAAILSESTDAVMQEIVANAMPPR